MSKQTNKIYLVEISDSVNTKTLEELSSLICSDHLIHNKLTKINVNYKMSIYSKLLTRVVIQQDLGIRNSDIEIDVSQYGKPFLKNNNEFHFNISHSQNMLAVSFSDKSVGIDVEQMRKTDLKIADRFFVREEIEYINQFQDKQLYRFFEIWTKKEAYLKYLGVGLNKSVKSFNVLDTDISNHFYTIVYGKYVITTYLSELNLTPPVIVIPEIALVELSKEL